ncbi:MAG: extracellular solute-binding protein [Ruminiclostridium sp.]|nr:extracellular solute-binding protein [Ruminiclostridium sp.]
MRTSKKAVSAILASLLIVGAAGCGSSGRDQTSRGGENAETTTAAAAVTTTEDPNKAIDTEANYDELANIEEVDTKNEEGAGKLYETGKTAGTLHALCFYDFHNVAPEVDICELYAERFGGTVETEIAGSLEINERLGVLMASGQSPDIIRSGWDYMPSYFINNRVMPLDDWLDIDSPIWGSMGDVIEKFACNGKHFYWPSHMSPNYGITYNTLYVESTGCEDPMDLYFAGEWTWDKFEEILVRWKSNSPDNIGISKGESSALHFAATTGTPAIEFTGTDILNNLQNANVMRTMEYIEKLAREDLVYPDWLGPDSDTSWDNTMFFIMPAEWAEECGQKRLFSKNLEGEIRTVPIPRDPNSDTYHLLGDTYGWLVPSGATNVQGAVSWILAGRIYQTDPEVIAAREDELTYDGGYYYIKCPECKHEFESERDEIGAVCPECNTPRKAKFKVTYTPEQMQVMKDMADPEKFDFVFDCHRGFGADMRQQVIDIFDEPMKGTDTYVHMLEENNTVVEATLDTYRDLIKQAGNS